MSKTDDQLKSEIDDNESRAEWGAWAVVVGLVIEIVLAIGISLDIDKKEIDNWGAVVADCLIASGVYCEIHFGRKASRRNAELRRRSEEKVAEATTRAAEADRARVELESRLQPRTLTQEQIAAIEGLRGKFDEITVARETDIESHLFAQQIALALMAAGIGVRQYRRASDVHTNGMQIYDPRGPTSVQPLVDIFRKTELSGGGSLVVISGPVPPDIPASSEIPMIIVGGRLMLPMDATIFARLAAKLDATDASNTPQSTNATRE